jgi:hypothetical protein
LRTIEKKTGRLNAVSTHFTSCAVLYLDAEKALFSRPKANVPDFMGGGFLNGPPEGKAAYQPQKKYRLTGASLFDKANWHWDRFHLMRILCLTELNPSSAFIFLIFINF